MEPGWVLCCFYCCHVSSPVQNLVCSVWSDILCTSRLYSARHLIICSTVTQDTWNTHFQKVWWWNEAKILSWPKGQERINVKFPNQPVEQKNRTNLLPRIWYTWICSVLNFRKTWLWNVSLPKHWHFQEVQIYA